MMNKQKLEKFWTYFLLILGSIIILVPILWMISTSLKIESETMSIPARWIPENITFEAYQRLWQDYPFLTYFKNSIIVAVISVGVSVVFSCLTGYGVTRFNFKGKQGFTTFLLMTQMFPSIMMLIPYYKILSSYNLTDSLLGLILVHISFTIPFCSWMMIGFFKTIPLDLDEAALIDGCTRFKVFSKIVLPTTLPGIASSAIYAFITSWNEYMFAQTIVTASEYKTFPLGLAELNGFYKIMWNDMMAASVIASIPLVIMFIFLQKYFVSGLTAGAVKS